MLFLKVCEIFIYCCFHLYICPKYYPAKINFFGNRNLVFQQIVLQSPSSLIAKPYSRGHASSWWMIFFVHSDLYVSVCLSMFFSRAGRIFQNTLSSFIMFGNSNHENHLWLRHTTPQYRCQELFHGGRLALGMSRPLGDLSTLLPLGFAPVLRGPYSRLPYFPSVPKSDLLKNLPFVSKQWRNTCSKCPILVIGRAECVVLQPEPMFKGSEAAMSC